MYYPLVNSFQIGLLLINSESIHYKNFFGQTLTSGMKIAVAVLKHFLWIHHCYLRSLDTYEGRTSLNSVSCSRHILDPNGVRQL
jgi:hypothetical protein